MTAAAAVPAGAIWMFQQVLSDILETQRTDRIALLSVGLAGLYVLSGVVTLIRTWITKSIAWRVTAELRRDLHEHHLLLSPHQQTTTGERIAALTHDVDELQYGVSAIVTAFRNPLTLVILGATAFWMAPELAPWALIVLPLVLLPIRWGGLKLRERGTEMRLSRAGLTRLMQEQLLGLRTVQSFDAADAELARYTVLVESDRAAKVKMEVQRVIPPAAVQAVAATAIGLLLWFGGNQVLAGELEPSKLAGFAGTLMLMNKPLSGLSEVWSLMQRSLAALERVYETLDLVPDIAGPDDPKPIPPGPLGIRWQDVVVDYGEGPVLRGVDLEVLPGEMLAVVGPTGGGKSTLLRLIPRHRDPERGRVELGGIDVRELAVGPLRRSVAVVAQDGFLFARSIADNIALGKPGATPEEIEQAARIAGAHAFIDALPNRYDTQLNELAQRLSGGQAQRICVARALITDAPVVVLDEATNQVDAQTERDILQALEKVRGGRTIVMIAHNLTAVRGADRIVVLADGVVSELGTHDELVAQDGSYAALWRAWLETEA